MKQCNEMKELMSACIDNRLNEDEKVELDTHVGQCDACMREWEALEGLVECLNELPEVDFPKDFHSDFMRRFALEYGKRAGIVFPYKKYAVMAAGIAAAIIITSGLGVVSSMLIGKTSINGTSSSAPSHSEDGAMEGDIKLAEASIQMGGFAVQTGSVQPDISILANDQVSQAQAAKNIPSAYGQVARTNEKIVSNSEIIIEAVDVKQAVAAINGLTGYTISSNISFDENYENASLVRRVEEQNLMYTEDVVRSLGSVIREDSSRLDYTNENAELEVRIKVTREEMDRLTLLISKSNSMDNIIYLNGRISELNYRLDNLMSRQKEIDGMSTNPYLSVQVVQKPKEDFQVEERMGFTQRVGTAFFTSYSVCVAIFQNILVFTAAMTVPIGVATAVGLCVLFIVRRISRRE